MKTLARTEIKLFLREPLGLFWGIAFPLVLLIVVGAASGDHHEKAYGGLRFIDVYAPVLMVFVMAILSLQALPQILSNYRQVGYLRRLSTTPVGPSRILGVQLALNLGITVVAMLVIAAMAKLVWGVALPREVVGFVVTILLAGLAMLAVGILVAAVAPNPRYAGLIGTLLFFPMMFFAGLWVPQAQMGQTLRDVGHLTPLGAAVAAVQQTMAGQWPSAAHLLVLAAYAVVLAPVAVRLFRWEQ
ncbi:MAG TPA: ABC transporter permease [Solirubrobacteraceae bacterium]|nr:ABC transporter permease [Solirubrobacteraceae bacterium]